MRTQLKSLLTYLLSGKESESVRLILWDIRCLPGGGAGVAVVCQCMDSSARKNTLFMLIASSPSLRDLCGAINYACYPTSMPLLFLHCFSFFIGLQLHLNLVLSHVLDATALFFLTHKTAVIPHFL